MNLRPTLLAFALVSLPVTANAQAVAPDGSAAATSVEVMPTTLPRAVTLTRPGVHATVESAVADELQLIDAQRIDVDGDGDVDVLGFVDVGDDADPEKPDLGRGVAVFFHERHGWRGETIASVGRWPAEAGFNWGEIERLRAGTTPLLHVLYSEARPGGAAVQGDTVVRFDNGSFRTVFASEMGRGPEHVTVRASDMDGDGTSELLEQVASDAHCNRAACVPARATRRVFHWDAAQGRFVRSASESGPVASEETQRGSADTLASARARRHH